MSLENIRNFCIIAHVDHGKSTLADRFLESTGTVTKREIREQFLDDMDLERERGITIKARAVAMRYRRGDREYSLNLIDTPGHVDFSYEVSRSLAACEGALLLVDASQGVEAQTVAHGFLAIEQGLRIIPIVNKIDLQQARPEEAAEEIGSVLGLPTAEVLFASGKTGEGTAEILEAIIERIPPPSGDPEKPLRALVFDAVYDDYRGVILYVRVMDGRLSLGESFRLAAQNRIFEATEIGMFRPNRLPCEGLSAGEVGYICGAIRSVADVRIGDTIVKAGEDSVSPLPGYRHPLPMVFCGLFPTEETDAHMLREALEKLRLNDASFTFEPEQSEALGPGYRCGFLGLLHMEISQERLEREGKVQIIQTAPNVTYELDLGDGKSIRIDNPARIPIDRGIREFREPIARISFILPSEYLGAVMKLCEDRRGVYRKTEYLSPRRVLLMYEMPLAEILFDFYDKLKSCTRGYGTMDYEIIGYHAADLVRLDIHVAGIRVDALSTVVHEDQAYTKGRRLVERLRKEIPRHLFEIPIQACIGTRPIARETIRALAKNVTSKCYGGDVSRKRKLLEKQKEGKKRMKNVGRVQIPQAAFLSILQTDT